MCGIVGIIQEDRRNLEQVVRGMADAMLHRGPDDGGAWADEQLGVAFGQRRLSILDLTAHGHQPMHSPDGRFTIVYNGEVYNFQELSAALASEGHVFQSRCDTEVVLAAIAAWGLERALYQFNGMFAFAVVDRKERVLHLARDRVGIKPLYFGWNANCFFFSSELKPLHRHPNFSLELDRSALALGMRHNYVPAPHSIYRGVYKLLPGCFLSLPIEDALSPGGFSPWPEDGFAPRRPRRYWDPAAAYEKSAREGWRGSEEQAVSELNALLKDSVRMQMISDVPLGVFLSGGLDSSTVAALAQNLSGQPIKTFSIGFGEQEYNEAPFAKAVAEHLQTDHTELYITGQDALDVIPKLPFLFDEPFSDSSQIPTYLVSKLARSKVTVSLSGDGGDELFCGYNRYPSASQKWDRIQQLPRSLRMAVGRLAECTGLGRVDDDFLKYSTVLPLARPETYYLWVVSHWKEPLRLVQGAEELATPLTSSALWPRESQFINSMMYLDVISYLPDDLLVKGDRASMGVSLEVRVPLLDHRVVEFAWRLPLSMKLRNNTTKYLLRKVLYRYVPQELIERPKRGFAVPVAAWLRGPLREWAEDLLDERRMAQEGFFDCKLVHKKWNEHCKEAADWDGHLWDVLMFQAWLRTYHGR